MTGTLHGCISLKNGVLSVYKIATYFKVSTDWLLGIPGAAKNADKASKDLCLTLGLSEDAIQYLRGETPLQLDWLEEYTERYKKGVISEDVYAHFVERGNRVREGILRRTQDTISLLITDHSSLLDLIYRFFDTLETDWDEEAENVGESFLEIDGSSVSLPYMSKQMSERTRMIEKAWRISGSIQDIIECLVSLKKKAIECPFDVELARLELENAKKSLKESTGETNT